ncbi:hypothetical protein INT44_006842 [Umbelopsis vinacea]|uniref:Uncharacterized protein n=1 Tax=Umbelopsis vinacea TaxID=44442 RepID=A0A8H7UCJ9_9FUNG|nr:hypothetical protein INT44_006842 [Umbelopsis vinacea]
MGGQTSITRFFVQQDYETLADGQWLNDTVIEFHTEYLEREVIPRDAKILILRPATVHLISHIQGLYKSAQRKHQFCKIDGQEAITTSWPTGRTPLRIHVDTTTT